MSKILLVPAFPITAITNRQSPINSINLGCESYIQHICDMLKVSKEDIIENPKSAYEGCFDEIINLFNIYCQWTDTYLIAFTDKNIGLPKKIADIDAMLTACFNSIAAKSKADLTVELENCIRSIIGVTDFIKTYITIDDNLTAGGKLIDWRNSIGAVEEEIKRKMSPQLNLPAAPEFNISFNSNFSSDWKNNSPYVVTPKDNQKWEDFSSALNGYLLNKIYADVLKTTVNTEDIDMALNAIINVAAWFDSFSKSLTETVKSIKFIEADDSADMFNLDVQESQNNWKSVLVFASALTVN